MSSNPVAPNERPSKRYAWVILNQTISPAFERLVARLCDELGPGLLLTGSDFARSSGLLEVRHGPAYDRRNLRRRLASWARFALWASAECARLKGAPVVIVPCLAMEGMDVYPDERRATAEWTMGVQSVALACQNLLLAAHGLGLGACWMCAALFVPEIIRRELDLAQEWHPQALITVGYPAETRASTREPLATKVIWR